MRLPVLLCLLLAACGTAYEVPVSGGPAVPPPQLPAGSARTPADFARVAARVEPAGEGLCREENPDAPARWCNYRIALDSDPKMPPNAFQTEGEDGRPVVVLGASLLAEMRSDDEIAFVLSHEMSHHIAGHIPKQAAAAGARRADLRRHRRRRRRPLRRPGLRPGDRAGDGHRRHPRVRAPIRRATSSRPTPSAPTSPPAPATTPSAAPRSSSARRSPTPAARRSSPATPARRSARPRSPRSPPRSAASRRSASSRPPAASPEKFAAAAILGVARHRRPP